MAKALSIDLRERVVAAVAGGLSRRQAAERFDISAASAVRWLRGQKTHGSVAPAKQGGDRKTQHIEAHAAFLLAQVEAVPDVTLGELQAKLIERGAPFGVTTIWRFFARRGITYKKDRACRRAAASRCEGGARNLV